MVIKQFKTALASIAVLMLMICSCSNNGDLFNIQMYDDCCFTSLTPQHTRAVDNTPWNILLDRLETKEKSILADVNISLSGYETVCKITEDNIKDIKSAIEDNCSVLPCYDESGKVCGVLAGVNTVASQTKNAKVTYNIERRNSYIDSEVRPGMSLVKLHWNCNDTITDSYCVVSDNSGIIYEDFITNTAVFETGVAFSSSKRQITKGEDSNFTGTLTWTLTATAEWLWGSERGLAQITHACHYSHGRIVGQESDAYAYMTIGHAVAQKTEIASNEIAYGYGLSTPLIDIYLSYSNERYSVSFSNNSGFKEGDTGTHKHF